MVAGTNYYVPAYNMTLDLNNKTFKIPFKTLTFVGENFTIKNGTIDGMGASYGLWLGKAGIVTKDVTIENVKVLGGINVILATNVKLVNCDVNADVEKDSNDYYAVWADYGAEIIVESGKYNAAAGKSAVNAAELSKVTVKGGEFSSNVTKYCEEGKHTAPEGDKFVFGAHSYTSKKTDATCEAPGYTTYTCACGDEYVADYVDALGHKYVGVKTDATCDAEGYTTYTCSVCGNSYVADKVAALGHDFKLVDTDEPTYNEEGKEYYECSRCDAEKTETIPVLTGAQAEVDGVKYGTFAEALAVANAGDTVKLLADIKASAIITIDKAITFDGNGFKLTSTAARAINVSGANGVTIKNLTIDAKGERAINVIQGATNVTIEGVNATAANYTVNLASSAANAVVTIKDSILNGLCTVNVSAAGAVVTITDSTINCNDNNTTTGESYAALALNTDAIGGKIIANGCTINVAEGSDSMKARNSANDGVITIDGSSDGVLNMVATITYPGSPYYHSFASLEAAVEFAKDGDIITLIRDVTLKEILTIDKAITLDGNGFKLTSTAARAINVETNGNVVIKDLEIVAAERAINIINKTVNVTVENVKATANNNAIMIATSAKNVKLTVNNSDLTGLAVINVAGPNAQVEINNTNITNVDATDKEDYGAITIWTSAEGADVVVNGGKIVVGDDSNACALFPADANITFNGTEGNTEVLAIVATVGDAGFSTLQEAVQYAKNSKYDVVLVRDVTLNKYVDVFGKVTIDLNGKTITSSKYFGDYPAIFGCVGSDLTIMGGGKITDAYNVCVGTYGIVTIKDVTLESTSTKEDYKDGVVVYNWTEEDYNDEWAKSEFGAIVIEDGAVIDSVFNYATLTINGGTIGTVESVGALVVNGGDIAEIVVEEGTIAIADPSAVKIPEDYKLVETEAGVYALVAKDYVAQVGDKKFETLAEALQAANGGTVEILADITEEIAAIENVTLTTNVEGGVTINSTYDDYMGFNNVTLGAGVTIKVGYVLAEECTNIIEGTLDVASVYYNRYDATTIIRNGGKTISGGMTISRYNSDPNAGFYIYGDGDDTTAEMTVGDTLGIYSGAFYAEDATIVANMIWHDYQKGTSQEPAKYAPIHAQYKNSTVKVASEFRFYLDSQATITNSNLTVGKVQIRENATPVINVDANSVIKATGVQNLKVENLDGATVNAVLGADDTVYFIKMAAKVGTKTYATVEEAIAAATAGQTVELLKDIEASAIITINKAITLDGNGFKLTSTAARAINVSGANGVTIKNLTIVAKGERAINVIQGATNVAIENVTATAANYTVNVASSAANAVVTIKDSILNGLCTVNVSAAGAVVTITDSTINCNDNNTTTGESYAALALNTDAIGGKIIANGCTINVAEGSDSMKARNSAIDGVITIDGSTDGVLNMVAIITYPGSPYYHAFASLKAAVEFAKDGETITLIRDIVLTKNIVISKNITIDLAGNNITGNFYSDYGMLCVGTNGNLTVKGEGKIANEGGDAFAVFGKLTIEEGVTVESYAEVGGYVLSPIYIPYIENGNATVVINGGKINGMLINGGNLTVNGGEIEMIFNDYGNSTINGGEIAELYLLNGTIATSDPSAIGLYEGYVLVEVEDGVYTAVELNEETAAAQIGDKFFLTLSEAMEEATATDTIIVLKDVTEELPGYPTGKLVAAEGKKITINATNTSWYYMGSDFELGEGITLNMPNGMPFVHRATVVINGDLIADGIYIRYAGTKLVINAPGSLTINGETFIIRDTQGDGEAGIYINGDDNDETVELKADVIYFYQGMINAKDATIQVRTYWQTQTTDAGSFANAGAANLVLDNSLMYGFVNDHNFKALGNSTVTLVNGSEVRVARGYEGVPVVMDDTSSFTKNGKSVFAAKVNNVAYLTVAEAIAAAQTGDTVKLLVDHEGTVVLPANVKLDLNSKTIKGNIVGTVAMNNGTWITPDKNYVMAGPEADYYITTDAVLTMDANGNIIVEAGRIELAQDWWTLKGQTLTIAKDATFVVPAGMNLNVLSTVIVEGTAIVDGTITLYDASATITVADDTLNVITIVDNAKVVYENGKYIVHVHVWSDATCTEPKTCVCGDTLGQALGHDQKTVAGKDATCTETGLTDGVVCDRCGETLIAQEEIPALGHDKKTVAGKDATCTETGLTDGVVCDRCGVTLKAQEEIPALGHKYSAVVTAPGKLTAGFTTYTCVCGDSYEANFVMPNCNEVQNVVATVIDGTMNLKVTWDALDRADIYLVYVYDANGNQVRGASVTRTYAQINGFAAGEYTVMVRARVGSQYTGIYEPVAVTFGTSAPVAEIVEVNKDSIKVQWNAVANADWYFVEIIGGGKRLVPGTSETSIVIDNLLPGTEYTVSICARYIENGVYKYTEYGVADKETTRGGASTDATAVVGGIKVTWTTDPAGDMYWLYRVDANGNTIKLLAATTETSALVDYIEGQNRFMVISRVMIDGKYKYIESDIFEYTGAPAVEVGFESTVAVEGDNGTTISWKSVPDGDAYWVYRVVNGEYVLVAATTSSTTVTVATVEGQNVFAVTARVIVDGKYRYITSDVFVAETHVSNAEDLKDALENIPEGGSGNIVLDGDINLDDLSGLLG